MASAERAKSGVCGATTVNWIAVAAESVPLEPLIVTVPEPTVAVFEAAKVTVLVPVVDAGVREAVTPEGRPLALKATVPPKPPVGVMVMVLIAVVPWLSDRLAGLAARENPGITGALTVRLTDAVCVSVPLVPVTVMLVVPVVAVLDAVKVSVLLPLVDAGLKLAVTPAGKPLVERATLPLNPPRGVTDTVLLPEPPWVTVVLVAASEKSGFCT